MSRGYTMSKSPRLNNYKSITPLKVSSIKIVQCPPKKYLTDTWWKSSCFESTVIPADRIVSLDKIYPEYTEAAVESRRVERKRKFDMQPDERELRLKEREKKRIQIENEIEIERKFKAEEAEREKKRIQVENEIEIERKKKQIQVENEIEIEREKKRIQDAKFKQDREKLKLEKLRKSTRSLEDKKLSRQKECQVRDAISQLLDATNCKKVENIDGIMVPEANVVVSEISGKNIPRVYSASELNEFIILHPYPANAFALFNAKNDIYDNILQELEKNELFLDDLKYFYTKHKDVHGMCAKIYKNLNNFKLVVEILSEIGILIGGGNKGIQSVLYSMQYFSPLFKSPFEEKIEIIVK